MATTTKLAFFPMDKVQENYLLYGMALQEETRKIQRLGQGLTVKKLSACTLGTSSFCADSLLFLAPQNLSVPKHAFFSSEEQQRQAKFLCAEDAQSYAVSHYLKRAVCASLCQKDPEQLCFLQDSLGKPYLQNSASVQLHFNISHSGSWCGLAVSVQAPVGFDIQSPFLPQDAPLETFVHKDDAFIPQNPQEMALLWSMKEAALKAQGIGLRVPLHSLCVQSMAHEQQGLFMASWPSGQFFVRVWQNSQGYAVAVASSLVQKNEIILVV